MVNTYPHDADSRHVLQRLQQLCEQLGDIQSMPEDILRDLEDCISPSVQRKQALVDRLGLQDRLTTPAISECVVYSERYRPHDTQAILDLGASRSLMDAKLAEKLQLTLIKPATL